MSETAPSERPRPIEVHDLTVAYRTQPVLWDVDLDASRGQLVAIVGPNGAGKSTLLKAVLGLVKPVTGWVQVFGERRTRRRSWVGYVPQRESVDWDFPTSALDVVTMGLYGRLGWFRRPGSAIARQALAVPRARRDPRPRRAARSASSRAASSSASSWPAPWPRTPGST